MNAGFLIIVVVRFLCFIVKLRNIGFYMIFNDLCYGYCVFYNKSEEY